MLNFTLHINGVTRFASSGSGDTGAQRTLNESDCQRFTGLNSKAFEDFRAILILPSQPTVYENVISNERRCKISVD